MLLNLCSAELLGRVQYKSFAQERLEMRKDPLTDIVRCNNLALPGCQPVLDYVSVANQSCFTA